MSNQHLVYLTKYNYFKAVKVLNIALILIHVKIRMNLKILTTHKNALKPIKLHLKDKIYIKNYLLYKLEQSYIIVWTYILITREALHSLQNKKQKLQNFSL